MEKKKLQEDNERLLAALKAMVSEWKKDHVGKVSLFTMPSAMRMALFAINSVED